jgi:hypothetical protein
VRAAALFERWPKLELAIEGMSIRWRTRAGLRAIERLPVAAAIELREGCGLIRRIVRL